MFSFIGMSKRKYSSFGFFIFRNTNSVFELLLLKAASNSSLPFQYSIAKGAKEANETDLEAAKREMNEETSLTENDLSVLPIPPLTYTYDLLKEDKLVCKEVIAYFALLTSSKMPIVSPEHTSFKWHSKVDIQNANFPSFLCEPYFQAFDIISTYFNEVDRITERNESNS